MEPAKIDWKTIESFYVEDSLYEHINAPKWVDFSSPPEQDKNQDEAWFCRPDCKHPKTVEDFYKLSPPSKLLSMVGISDMLQLRDRNRRDANLKRRQQLAVEGRADENAENNNPNLLTPSSVSRSKSVKENFKSSADHKAKVTDSPAPKLKSTLSAKNLLGRDIFSHIQDFCNELKKLTTRTREKEEERNKSAKNVLVCDEKKVEVSDDDNMDLDDDDVVRTPLLVISKEKKLDSATNSKEKLRRLKRNGELENIPLAIDLNSIKHGESDQSLQKIRTNPPTPQCFSAARGQARANATPTSSSKSRLKERSILQEVKLGSKGTPKKKELQKGSKIRTAAAPSVAEKEAKMMDVFWFLKPCTVSEGSN